VTIPWLAYALDYVQQWLEHQLRITRVLGCVLAVVHRGEVIAERAYGVADLKTGMQMTPDHRFRVASHSKSLWTIALATGSKACPPKPPMQPFLSFLATAAA
jgi:CubicO group peptidase (beta-lactamase class C family)